jgi:calcineurin-like phosphoesterase family protein
MHFYHYNIIGYCNRPFKTVEEMNETIVKNWNDTVKSTDSVYVLGDVSFGFADQTRNILCRLNGFKHLIMGNHDRKGKHSKKTAPFPWEDYFESVSDYRHLNVEGILYVLCHFPFSSWEPRHINLHGHTHGTHQHHNGQWDVGVDCNEFRPITYLEARDRAIKQNS